MSARVGHWGQELASLMSATVASPARRPLSLHTHSSARLSIYNGKLSIYPLVWAQNTLGMTPEVTVARHVLP